MNFNKIKLKKLKNMKFIMIIVNRLMI